MTIHAEYPTPKGVGVPQRLRNALAKSDGKGCQCFALYSGECSCDADWRSMDEILIDWIWSASRHRMNTLPNTRRNIGTLFHRI